MTFIYFYRVLATRANFTKTGQAGHPNQSGFGATFTCFILFDLVGAWEEAAHSVHNQSQESGQSVAQTTGLTYSNII